MALHDVACVAHVHSRFSDGTASVEEIAAATSRAGARVVLLTDHDSLEAARRGLEGWHGDVLVLVGHEISPRGGHFLAFGLDREVDHRGRTEEEICAEVAARGGFGFAAHPFSRGSRISTRIGRPHPWRGLTECPEAGVELWSLVTDAAERWRGPRDVIAFLRRPEAALTGPPPEHLAEWDRLCAARRVPAIGGLDAHQTGVRVGSKVLSPLPHSRFFGLLRTHVLLDGPLSGELAADRAAVYHALRQGRCYLAFDALAPGGGFRFQATAPDRAPLSMGAEATGAGWTLRARTPRPARLRLLRDGRPIRELEADGLEQLADGPGVYRLQAHLHAHGDQCTWIVSNPIYLRGGH